MIRRILHAINIAIAISTIAAIITVASVIVAGVRLASAHDWYPLSCCSEKDCFPVSPELIEVTAEGYVYLPTGELIRYGSERITPPDGGGDYHICTYGGNPAAKIIGATRPQACFWAPQIGS